jgi:RNase P/RNase MRP subunit POP5
MKGLLPSLREQNRYILFEVLSEKTIDYPLIASAILEACKSYLGCVGFAKAGPMLIRNRWRQDSHTGIVKVNRKYADWIKASFALIKTIKNSRVIIRSRKVSGTLRKAC